MAIAATVRSPKRSSTSATRSWKPTRRLGQSTFGVFRSKFTTSARAGTPAMLHASKARVAATCRSRCWAEGVTPTGHLRRVQVCSGSACRPATMASSGLERSPPGTTNRSEQAQLTAFVRRAAEGALWTGMLLTDAHLTAGEAKAARGLVEEQPDGFDVRPLPLHAAAEARVVELAAAHFAHPSQHLFSAERQGFAQALNEDGLDTTGQPERNHRGAGGAGLACSLQDVHDVAIAEPRDERRNIDRHRDALRRESAHGLDSSGGCGNEGLERARSRGIPKWNRDRDGGAAARGEFCQQIGVTLDQSRLGDDVQRVAVLYADCEAGSGQAVARFQRLITIRIAAEKDELPLPARLLEGLTQERGGLHFDHDLAFEVRPGAETQVLVRGAGVAIGAAVQTATVRIDAELETQIGTVVVGKDVPGLILVHRELDAGGVLLVAEELFAPGVWRVS